VVKGAMRLGWSRVGDIADEGDGANPCGKCVTLGSLGAT
jgi:hypothetical protein